MKKSVRVIFHIDLNQFYCSCALIENKSLKGKPFAIGRENSFKGVLSTASYEARKYGVKSGMSLREAFNLCPKLIIVNHDMRLYKYYSDIFFNYLSQYSQVIEKASIDECYMDVTHLLDRIHPEKLALHIQNELLHTYNLPVSIGIGPTMFLAKMASDLKKPLGITVLRKRDIKNILYPLDVSSIYGIGMRSSPKLHQKNIHTIADFMNTENKDIILQVIGKKQYDHAVLCLLGQSSDVVDPNKYSNFESISTSRTFDNYLIGEQLISDVLIEMTKNMHAKLKFKKYCCKTVSITLRDKSFKTITRSFSFNEYTNDYYIVADKVLELFEDNYNLEEIRLCGVGLSNLIKEEEIIEDYNLFTLLNRDEKDEKLDLIITNFKNKFGEKIIKKGTK